jgi:hypothetical protein
MDLSRGLGDVYKRQDLLRNQHIFRNKMNEEIGTYQRL